MTDSYDLILFDMDGTLLNSFEFHNEAFYRFINKNLMKVDKKTVASWMGITVANIFSNAGIDESEFEDVFEKLLAFYENEGFELAKGIPPADGINEFFTEIKKRGIKTVVLTNSMGLVARIMLRANNLEIYFDDIVGADIYSVNKIERCKKIEEKFAAEKVLYVGDMENDIELANEMGYDSCFAHFPFGWYQDEEYIMNVLRPTFRIEKLTDMLEFI